MYTTNKFLWCMSTLSSHIHHTFVPILFKKKYHSTHTHSSPLHTQTIMVIILNYLWTNCTFILKTINNWCTYFEVDNYSKENTQWTKYFLITSKFTVYKHTLSMNYETSWSTYNDLTATMKEFYNSWQKTFPIYMRAHAHTHTHHLCVWLLFSATQVLQNIRITKHNVYSWIYQRPQVQS